MLFIPCNLFPAICPTLLDFLPCSNVRSGQAFRLAELQDLVPKGSRIYCQCVSRALFIVDLLAKTFMSGFFSVFVIPSSYMIFLHFSLFYLVIHTNDKSSSISEERRKRYKKKKISRCWKNRQSSWLFATYHKTSDRMFLFSSPMPLSQRKLKYKLFCSYVTFGPCEWLSRSQVRIPSDRKKEVTRKNISRYCKNSESSWKFALYLVFLVLNASKPAEVQIFFCIFLCFCDPCEWLSRSQIRMISRP